MFGRKLRTPHAIARRRKIRIIFSVVGVVVLCLSVWGIIELMRVPGVRIASIEVHGAQAISEDEVTQSIQEELAGTYFGLIPKDNTFVYPRRTIERALLDAYPRASSLTLAREGMQALVVSIVERQPHALWCGDIVPSVADIVASINPRCFFLDATGFLFSPAPSYSGTPYHRFFGAIAESRVVGQPFLPEDEYRTLYAFMDSLSDGEVPVYGLLVIDDDELEVYLANGTRLLVRRGDDLNEVRTRIRSLMVSDEFAIYETADIDYIDLRFGNRVYIKPIEQKHHADHAQHQEPIESPAPTHDEGTHIETVDGGAAILPQGTESRDEPRNEAAPTTSSEVTEAHTEGASQPVEPERSSSEADE